jgi:hypothetical protein
LISVDGTVAAVFADANGELTPAENAMMAEWLDRLADRT